MGYDPTTCFNSLRDQSLGPCPNALGTAVSYHCTDAQETNITHEYCSQNNLYYKPFKYMEAYDPSLCAPTEYDAKKCNEQVFDDLDHLVDYLLAHPNMKKRECWCCCSCMAYGTPIAIPTGLKAIEKIVEGEEVMSGALTNTNGKLTFTWTPATVTFSQGTPPTDPLSGIATTMVFIYCREDLGLISTEDQLLMTSAGTLKQANTLKPGDQLVTVDGEPVAIQSIKIGNWSGGVHHITAGKPFTGDINGHLISAGSFVVGDFSVQLDPTALGEKFEAGPPIGSTEYDKANEATKLKTGVYSMNGAAVEKISLPKNFKLFRDEALYIPFNAKTLITNEQAIDIVGNPNAYFRPYGNKSGVDILRYLFKLYKGFYPEYTFYLDWENITPNAYAFDAYGTKTVVISGGLVRLQGMYQEGLAFIISYGIASLSNPIIYNGPHPLPTIQADYYGMGLVMPTTWYTTAYDVSDKAIAQMKQFWGYISEENQQGNPENNQDFPSIKCRINTLMYAQMGGNLPACAQPPQSLLKLTGEEVGILSNQKPFVWLSFNQDLDEASSEAPANYSFSPEATISSVAISPNNNKAVIIVADFQENVEYTVTVKQIKSNTGSPLDPQKSTIKFTAQ
ncbi:Ig-like domain-containing protein [Chitinophaga sancti]|uniref:Ig-like domain-containing protein n=1 Tax=Chitinophaga sancti TaxID=1004 RepID=A0A1K1RTE1_9BACT|nr:Ig-like domain-containing protein [Chitinophaga sancti]WQD62447.1 Ig-like domain-containing protein [Chitinophaga sancti]WQG91984.1 Ig-like domain-containing protein [Chitinophaga sancti]SFW75060.1 hypothetical protein SAMN05661012_04185 [Chitinophaga sancti]